MKNFFNSAKLTQKHTGVLLLAGCGMLLALEVVLGMFTLNVSPILKIGFSFLPVAAAGMLFGPVAGGAVGALGDIVSYFISPTGPYFPGFTINGFVSGFLYGIFLYQKHVTLLKAFLAKTAVTIATSLLLTPLWLSILYSKAFFAVLSARIVTNLILLPIDILLLYGLMKAMEKEALFHIRKT
ncbi:folate family ECF transporter S component [Caproiciproducens sp. NJN-50]|uniref:folate family ECF transporter S component n=1 Tax=Acutalibacteraceae TaxID=3082771 RepID=UPI000FFE3175|nr:MULTISPECIES: folate family ECF transporter S component [Acutalibacteraceae]QAT50158.1 folate family ECF transporter S component [Caproiciproducens sp. NJN-50]